MEAVSHGAKTVGAACPQWECALFETHRSLRPGSGQNFVFTPMTPSQIHDRGSIRAIHRGSHVAIQPATNLAGTCVSVVVTGNPRNAKSQRHWNLIRINTMPHVVIQKNAMSAQNLIFIRITARVGPKSLSHEVSSIIILII